MEIQIEQIQIDSVTNSIFCETNLKMMIEINIKTIHTWIDYLSTQKIHPNTKTHTCGQTKERLMMKQISFFTANQLTNDF